MTNGPEDPSPHGRPADPYGPPPPPPTAPYGQPGWGQGQPGYPGAPGAWGAGPGAPYGIHPATGIPYSEKSKIVAGLLQILLPLGIGRFYTGDTGLGVAQLIVTLVTCGIGALWPFIDGIIMLVTDSLDAQGYILRS